MRPEYKDVVKALNYCVNDIHDGDCNPDCPYYKKCEEGGPIPAVLRDALILLRDVEGYTKTIVENCQEVVKYYVDYVPRDLFLEVLTEYESVNRGLIWATLQDEGSAAAYKALEERVAEYKRRAGINEE